MRSTWLALVLCLASCDRGVPIDYGLCLDAAQRTSYFPLSIESELDLLLVMDTSPAMQAKASALADSLPAMVEALRVPALKNDLPDVHIGVISADLGAGDAVPGCTRGGDRARLLHAPRVNGCTPPTDPWISYTGGLTNMPAGAGDPVERVKQALRCIGTLGSSGCLFSQPLEAARRALDPGLNPGFLRKDAFLVLMFITSGDDCSAARPQLFDPGRTELGPLSPFRCFEHGISCDVNDRTREGPRTNCKPAHDWLHRVEDYAAFFKGLKPPGRVVLLVVSGPTDRVQVQLQPDKTPALAPSCSSGVGQGTPAIRLEALARALGDNGHFNDGTDHTLSLQVETTICSEDYSPPLWLLSRRITISLGNRCLQGLPLTLGCELACNRGAPLGEGQACEGDCLERADCVVYEQVSSTKQITTLPPCPGALFRDPAGEDCAGHCPCWRLVPSKACKSPLGGSDYELEILRAPGRRAPRGAVAVVSCTTTLHAPGSPGWLALPRCR